MAEQYRPRRDLYAEVTTSIIAALESGTPPWRRPWDPTKAASSGPINGATGREYRGINTLLLGMHPLSFSSGDPRWLTFKQSQEKGWQVRKGAKASTVVFFKRVEVDGNTSNGDEGDRRVVPVLRSYPVFHASVIDGIPAYVPPSPGEVPWRTPEAAATILAASAVEVRHGGDRAFYSPGTDHLQLPPVAAFHGPEQWAATALHELGHATGHPSRLNRDLRGRFGSQAYAMEELRAEIASAMLSSALGIPSDIPQHASYVEGWLEVLRKDRRAIFSAASDAQKIADWCLLRHPAYASKMQAETTIHKIVEPTVVPTPAPAPQPVIPAAVAAMGPMPRHIARRLNPEPAVPGTPTVPTPTLQETPSCGYRPR